MTPLNTQHKIARGQENFECDLKLLGQTFSRNGETIYKARNEIKRMSWHGVSVIIKSFKVPGFIRGIIYGQLRQSKAKRSFEHALELQQRAITTPSPIGFIEHRSRGVLKQSFYICHEWPATFTLREPLFNPSAPNREEILKAFGRFSSVLHQKQIHHKDLSPGNILIQKTRAIDWDFCLVDINRLRFESLSFDQRMRNFAMLWACDKDLETIVTAYAQCSGDNVRKAINLALEHSQRHKARAMRKERIKTFLKLH